MVPIAPPLVVVITRETSALFSSSVSSPSMLATHDRLDWEPLLIKLPPEHNKNKQQYSVSVIYWT